MRIWATRAGARLAGLRAGSSAAGDAFEAAAASGFAARLPRTVSMNLPARGVVRHSVGGLWWLLGHTRFSRN